MTLLPRLKPRDLDTIPALRRTLSQLPEGPLTPIVHSFFLRSLRQAVYAPVDIGHFGLGIDRYCHFTSPIRRYPDLFNHRVLRWLLHHPRRGHDAGAETRHWQRTAPEQALHCSGTERNAERAEREIVRLKLLRWAQRHIGEIFQGRVTGMTHAGVFVELEEHPVDGFVPREGLGSAARYDAERLAFAESRSQWTLRLGDPVQVQIVRVDLRERHLDLALLRGPALPRGKRGREPERPARRDRKGRGSRVHPERKTKRSVIKTSQGRADAKRGKGKSRPPGPRKRPRGGGTR
jgi:ribonuclease R